MNRRTPKRRGLATVEFAMVAPLLGVLIIGMLELSRGMMVYSAIATAARNGGQVAALPSSSNSTVTTRINSVLTSYNITSSNATITIQVNGVTADVSTASANDKLTITVSIPANRTTLTNFLNPFLTNTTISTTVSFMRQG